MDMTRKLTSQNSEIVSERIIDRARGNLAGASAAGKYLWNRISGHKDRNQQGFRETTRNARFYGTIRSHAKAVQGLVHEINKFIAQQQGEGKDTTELENISNGINDFFARNEKILGLGIGDENAEDYKNQELPSPTEGKGGTGGQPSEGAADGGNGEQPSEVAAGNNGGAEQSAEGTTADNGGQPSEGAADGGNGEQPAEGAADGSNGGNGEQPAEGTTDGGADGASPTAQPPQSETKQTPQPQPAAAATPTPPPPPAEPRQGGTGRTPQPRPTAPTPPPSQPAPPPRKKKSGFWTNDNVWLNARHESVSLDYLYNQLLLSECREVRPIPEVDISWLYNSILISEAQEQPTQQLPPEINNAIVQVYSKLGDLADSGNEEDKDFAYQLIQKIAQKTPMQDILKELEARAAQEKQQQQQPQEGVTEGFDNLRRKFYARQAGKEAAKNGGDRKAAQQEAYDNRIYEFQTRLDRALGELSLDLKTMGYKQQGSDADKLILAFRKAVSQFSKSKKEEGETSWLQRRRHGLGHALATSATYAALRAICPATILGNKYFARGLYGAATSVIRDVSRGNLNKKSILRALVGAGIAAGGSYIGDKVGSYIKGALGGQGNAPDVANSGVDGNGAGGNAVLNGRDWSANPGQVKMMANNIGMANGLNPNVSSMTQNLAADNPEIIDILQDKNSVEQINQMYQQYWDSLPPVGDPGRKAAVSAGREALKKSIEAMAKSNGGGDKLTSLLSKPFTYNPMESDPSSVVDNAPTDAFDQAADAVVDSMPTIISKRGAETFLDTFRSQFMNSGNEEFIRGVMRNPQLMKQIGVEFREPNSILRDVFMRNMLSAWHKNGGDVVAAFQAARKAMP